MNDTPHEERFRLKKSLLFLVIGRLKNWCGDAFFFSFFFSFLSTSEIRSTMYMCTQLLEPDQISHTQSMVAKRGLTNRANVHTPTCV